MFENQTIHINSIPKYEEATFSSLHANYKKIVKLNSIIKLLVGLVVAIVIFFVFEEFERFYFIIAIIAITFLLALFPLLAYKKIKYAFRAHDLLLKKGLIYKTTHIVPFIRLQHIVIKQGWYAKKLGLATLTIFTATNDNLEVSIPGLTLEEAEQWKSFLLNRIQELEDV